MKSPARYAALIFLQFGALALVTGCHAANRQGVSQVTAPILATPSGVAALVHATEPLAAPKAVEPFSVPIVELRGSPDEMGRQHGQRLGPEIRLLHDSYLTQFIHGAAERFVALTAAQAFSAKLTPDYRDEVAAMAKAAKIDGREAMLGQCFLDLIPMTACSTVALSADASPDDVARLGRNLEFPSMDVADKYSTVFIDRPAGKYAFASIGWPGLIGVLSGMNEHGLTIANMEVTRGLRLPTAVPYTILYREILEQCKTTDAAIDFLKRTPRQTSNNLIIMDATGDRAVAEISPGGVTIRRPDKVCLISTNHRRGTDNATPGKCWRYDLLRQESEQDFGRIGVPQVESMLASVSQEEETLQSMIFEPASRVIYLSAGKDAAHYNFHRLDLRDYFGH